MKREATTKKTVCIGLIGSTLDQGKTENRWERWRPTVGICQQDDLCLDRLHILYHRQAQALFRRLKGDIALVSPETEVIGHEIQMADPWDFEEVFATLHQFCIDFQFDTESEEYLVHITTGTHVAQICLFLLTESRHFPGRLLQASPLPKKYRNPAGTISVIDLDLSRYDGLAARFHDQTRDHISYLKSGIETRNAAFNQLIERIEKVVLNSVDPILLTGPTGAGKSRLAEKIFELRKRHHLVDGSFVAVNCSTLQGSTAMSTLFGHRRGAYTGATEDREGLLRIADGGVLFLDEVGELGSDEQTMLLHAIEHKQFRPVGSDTEVRSSFQLICGTNRDLRKDVRSGRFREDLLARIDLWTFRLPGLTERVEDIEPNLDYELDDFMIRTGRRITINKEARDTFLQFSTSPNARWLGNFRDLSGAVTRMATLADGGRIRKDLVSEQIQQLKERWGDDEDSDVLAGIVAPDILADMDTFDRLQLKEVLRICRHCRSLSEAGRRLFDVSRTKRASTNDADRLRKYLARFNLQWSDLTTSPPTTE